MKNPNSKKLLQKLKNPRYRSVILSIADALIIFISSVISDALISFLDRRSSLNFIISNSTNDFWAYTALSVLTGFLLLQLTNAHTKLWRNAAKMDYLLCGLMLLLSKTLTMLVVFLLSFNLYLPFCICDTVLTIVGALLFRRIFRNAFLGRGKKSPTENILIVGAGRTAKLIIEEINIGQQQRLPGNPVDGLKVIGMTDDNPMKKFSEIDGIRVLGDTSDIPAICKEFDVKTIYFAILSCDERRRAEILKVCTETGAKTYVVPYLLNLIADYDKNNIMAHARPLNVDDLLGRPPIALDSSEIVSFIKDKVCLVTGGGGSIGSELVRQIAACSPAQLIIVDIYENSAYAIEQELKLIYGDSLNLVTLIASIRDREKMDLIFKNYHPDLVFHAAAHKHVPLMEASPEEAVKNNVFGTQNIVELANKYRVKKFVQISTDKAVNPTNVMGATKRCCEMLIEEKMRQPCNTEYVITRFGNVLGSNGSVIPLFQKQIEAGGPVLVTHPEITRYFMTIPEAVSLVLKAMTMANGGEVFVLDMGEPVKIVTLAENMIRLYGKRPYEDIDIKFIGLRPGEKLYEELFNKGAMIKTSHEKIFIGSINRADNTYDGEKSAKFFEKLQTLREAAFANDSEATIAALKDIVPTFTHS